MIMMMWTGSLCSWIYFKRNTLNLESSIITMHWTRLQNNFRPFNYFGYSKNTEGISTATTAPCRFAGRNISYSSFYFSTFGTLSTTCVKFGMYFSIFLARYMLLSYLVKNLIPFSKNRNYFQLQRLAVRMM